MTFDPLSAAFDLGRVAIEKIWPDPSKRSEQMRELEKLRQDGDLQKLSLHVQLMLGQLEVNKLDAQSANFFQSGWRPSIGWVGSISLALMYIPKAIMMTVIWSWQCIAIMQDATNIYQVQLPAFPDLGVSDIIGLLMSMLGVAAMRSYDKKNSTDTKT